MIDGKKRACMCFDYDCATFVQNYQTNNRFLFRWLIKRDSSEVLYVYRGKTSALLQVQTVIKNQL